MTSYFDLHSIAGIGVDVANQARGASKYILTTGTAIAFAVAYAKQAVPGRSAEGNPLRVLFHALGLALLLVLYGYITSAIAGASQTVSASVAGGGSFDTFLSTFHTALRARLDPELGADADWTEKVTTIAANWGAGLLSGLLSVLGILAVLVFYQLYVTLQAILYALLVAVGPLMIALSILPGASSLVGKWLTGLFELAMWPVLGSILFEMLAKAGLGHIYADNMNDFVALACANVIFVVCVMMIPIIASRLVGGGFSALGGMALAGVTSKGRMLGRVFRSPDKESERPKPEKTTDEKPAYVPGGAS
ncbi:MAG: hypothetical protein IT381_27720 [Deltaproteobacteria bacterium]|nr:hypothetical protein [Deltaproteobacteria bacterium]